MNGGWGISYEIALRWMPQALTDDKSTLVQVMAWCRQATSHYLSQCWPRSMSPNVVIRSQRVKAGTTLMINYIKLYADLVSSMVIRDHFVYALSQWEWTLHCNVASHWLGTYTKWSMSISFDVLLHLGNIDMRCVESWQVENQVYAVKLRYCFGFCQTIWKQ